MAAALHSIAPGPSTLRTARIAPLALSLPLTKNKTTDSRLVRFLIEPFCLIVSDEA